MSDAKARALDAQWYRFGVSQAGMLWLVLGLALLFSLLRVVGVFGGGRWQYVLPVSFVVMALLPWLLYRPAGRWALGLVAPQATGARLDHTISVAWLDLMRWLALGMAAAFACYGIGMVAFGDTVQHWYVSIGQNFAGNLPASSLSSLPLWALALMFIVPAALFSPIGEEMFFRGVLQHSLEQRLSPAVATWLECSWFALVHLCHHGLVLHTLGIAGLLAGDVSVIGPSAWLWVLLMLAVARLFVQAKRSSGSLYGAMVCHCGFNISMGLCIFLLLWPLPQ